MSPIGNSWLEKALIPAIIILVALSAFGLGRLSASPANEAGQNAPSAVR